jgi:hypothetical protein
MAYMNVLASVTEEQVLAIRQDEAAPLRPSLRVGVSHLLATWIDAKPLGELLGTALDGGRVLNEKLWHPLRPPVYHDPASVVKLHDRIADAWQKAREGPKDDMVHGFRIDIAELLRLFGHAAGRRECVVSALGPPADEERASKVRWPLFADEGPVAEVEAPAADGPPSRWALVGLCGGLVGLGLLGLGYWRYRRFRQRDC